MKRFLYLLVMCLFPFVGFAQEPQGEPQTIASETPKMIMEITEGSGGNIDITIPDDITNNIFPDSKPPVANNGEQGNEPNGNPTASTDNKKGNGKESKTTSSSNTTTTKVTKGNGPTKKVVRKMQGYRIQVFSDGRNPQTLQARARARGNAVVAKFPKYRGQVYTFSSSPNWYTRIGNFETQAEASKALGELKRAFPQFAGEMRIVKSQVTITK